MKKQYNIASLALAFVFIFGIIVFILEVNSLPDSIYQAILSNHLLTQLYLVFGAGLCALVFNQVAIKTSAGKEVVYVEKIAKNKEEIKEEVRAEEESGKDFGSFLQNLEESILKETDHKKKAEKLISMICNKMQAGQGILYYLEDGDNPMLKPLSTYAYLKEKSDDLQFELGQGLPGLAAKENKFMSLENIPEGYLNIFSGLGTSSPKVLIILPLVNSNNVVGILELALFWKPEKSHQMFFQQLSEILGKMMHSKNI